MKLELNVLLLNDSNNTEMKSSVEGAAVKLALRQCEDRTILVFHKRRRKNSRKKNGHRQQHSKIQIIKILSKGGKLLMKLKIVEKKAALL